jgi:hypothetical protein
MTTRISTLPTLAAVTDATIIPVVEGGATKRITGLALKTYTGTASGPQGPSGPSGAAGSNGASGPSGPSGPGTLNSGTAGYVPYYSGTTALSAATSGNMYWDNTNGIMGLGTTSPVTYAHNLAVYNTNYSDDGLPLVYVYSGNAGGGGSGNKQIGLFANVPTTRNSDGAIGVKGYASSALGQTSAGVWGESSAGGGGIPSSYGVYGKFVSSNTDAFPGHYAVFAETTATGGTSPNATLIGVGSQTHNYATSINFQAVSLYSGSNTQTMFDIRRNGSQIGTITTTASATAYNTGSDYRLKDNPQPLTGSGAFIDALQPKTWTWKRDGTAGVGFIAHEVQAVSPGSVHGVKDAVDHEGNPVIQTMEYGSAEFIANIVAELQSLRARVAQLEAKV